MEELRQGCTLKGGKYKIDKVLGQGSFGITYLATAKFTTQGNLGKMDVEAKVAIKEFFMSEVNSRQSDGSTVDGSFGSVFTNYRKKFRKEAENLSRLSHPNIVKVFDVFDENNTTYYVMEFLEGTNLDDYIKQHFLLSEDEAISIIKEIGGALAYMHSKKMLHLDIKPKNIMRKADGMAFLIDFGLSKQYTEEGEPESSTSIGLGTPGYAPLEQSGYKQDGSFPATLDVYALGATLFKMLTGKRPPEATNILNEGFPSALLYGYKVSNHTVAALEKAMKSVRKDRYQNVSAFLNGLEHSNIDEVTVIESSVNSKSNPHSHSQAKPTPKHKSGWYFTSVVLVIGAIILWRENIPPNTPSDVLVVDTTAIIDVDTTAIINTDIINKVKRINRVTDMIWDSPLGKATYTGFVELDSVYGSTKLLPHGKGIAKMTEGLYAGNVYDGEFEYGTMHGKTTYTQWNGDTFVGTFSHNKYDRGRYTVNATGEYFEGSFKNGQPYKGTWYDKKGKKL